MEFKIVNPLTTQENELIKVITENVKTSELMKEEIKKLQKLAATSREQKKIIVEPIEEEQPLTIEESKATDDFEDEVDYYLTSISSLTKDNLQEQLELTLPVRKNYNYKNILYRLKLELIKTLREIKELIEEEKDNLQASDLNYFEEALLLEKKKLDFINQKLTEKTNQTEPKTTENKLIFVPTSSGNIRVLEELENRQIPNEYYEDFIGLFRSIKDGTFKNVKRFVANNNNTSGLCEVKDYQTRVVFDRIGPDSYAILTAFVKKSDNDRGYVEQLAKKIQNYRSLAPIIKENLKNEEFLKANKQYEEELFKILGKEDKKSPQKFKKEAK